MALMFPRRQQDPTQVEPQTRAPRAAGRAPREVDGAAGPRARARKPSAGPSLCRGGQGQLSLLPETKSKTEKLQLKMRHLACADAGDREGCHQCHLRGGGCRLRLRHQTGHSALHEPVSSRNITERGFRADVRPEGAWV